MPYFGETDPIDLRSMADVPRYRSMLEQPEPGNRFVPPPEFPVVCRCGAVRPWWSPRCHHGAGDPPPATWLDTFTLAPGRPEPIDPPTIEIPVEALRVAASRPAVVRSGPVRRRGRRLRPLIRRQVHRAPSRVDQAGPVPLEVAVQADRSTPDVDPARVAEIVSDLRTRRIGPVSAKAVRRDYRVGHPLAKAVVEELARTGS